MTDGDAQTPADARLERTRHPFGDLVIETRRDRDEFHVGLAGELDLATTPLARRTVGRLLVVAVRRLVVDLSELAFLDSTGLRFIAGLAERSQREPWELEFVPGAQVQRIFAVAGLADVLPFTGGRRAPRDEEERAGA